MNDKIGLDYSTENLIRTKFNEIIHELEKMNELKEKELALKEEENKLLSYFVEMDLFDRRQKILKL